MDYQEECLRAHNKLRENHQAPPLILNEELSKHSQKLADYLSIKHEYGENTFCLVSSDGRRPTLAVDAIDLWYKDVEKHDFNTEPTVLSSGKFTQLVWKDTTDLGIGYAKHEGKVVIVANYYPPGNMQGEFKQNVQPKIHNSQETSFEEDEDELNALEKVKNDCLRMHNYLRYLHGSPALKLSDTLCQISQKLADYLIKKAQYGENTYCIISTDPNRKISGDEAVLSWYNEAERHNFSKDPTDGSTKNFSQLVWKNSKELGVGLAIKDNRTVIVANYDPPGNIIGEFVENVTKSTNSTSDDVASDMDGLSLKNEKAGTSGNFVKDFLKAHNEYRVKNNVLPLEIHPFLSNYSQQWASFLAAKDELLPREHCPFGENIYCVNGSFEGFTIPGRKPVDFWYDEVKHKDIGDLEQMENYAQVISKVSKYLGVGVAKSESENIYVVSNYASEKAMEQKDAPNGDILKGGHHIDESGFTGFAKDGLEMHNLFRRMHGVPPLVLSKEVSR